MVKTLDTSAENFVASTTKAIQNYKRDLMVRQKVKKEFAIRRSIKFGIKMLNSGLGDTITPEKAEGLFREQSKISKMLADYCKRISEK